MTDLLNGFNIEIKTYENNIDKFKSKYENYNMDTSFIVLNNIDVVDTNLNKTTNFIANKEECKALCSADSCLAYTYIDNSCSLYKKINNDEHSPIILNEGNEKINFKLNKDNLENIATDLTNNNSILLTNILSLNNSINTLSANSEYNVDKNSLESNKNQLDANYNQLKSTKQQIDNMKLNIKNENKQIYPRMKYNKYNLYAIIFFVILVLIMYFLIGNNQENVNSLAKKILIMITTIVSIIVILMFFFY